MIKSHEYESEHQCPFKKIKWFFSMSFSFIWFLRAQRGGICRENYTCSLAKGMSYPLIDTFLRGRTSNFSLLWNLLAVLQILNLRFVMSLWFLEVGTQRCRDMNAEFCWLQDTSCGATVPSETQHIPSSSIILTGQLWIFGDCQSKLLDL